MAIIKIKHKGLRELYHNGITDKISDQRHEKIVDILDFLDLITKISDCKGVYGFHRLKGDRKKQYAMSVSGNYRIVFNWNGEDVTVIDYEDYH